MTVDLIMTKDDVGIYDFSLDENGDLAAEDFFDTSLLGSILGERRALPSEMPESSQRRGWIGNEFSDFEDGSKLWLFYQARLTRSILNEMRTEALLAVQWLIDDGWAVSIDAEVLLNSLGGGVELTIFRSSSKVDKRFFQLWENTGV